MSFLTDGSGNDITAQSKKEVCIAYILHDFLPQLLDLPYIEDYDGKQLAVGEYITNENRQKPKDLQEHWWDVKYKPKGEDYVKTMGVSG